RFRLVAYGVPPSAGFVDALHSFKKPRRSKSQWPRAEARTPYALRRGPRKPAPFSVALKSADAFSEFGVQALACPPRSAAFPDKLSLNSKLGPLYEQVMKLSF